MQSTTATAFALLVRRPLLASPASTAASRSLLPPTITPLVPRLLVLPTTTPLGTRTFSATAWRHAAAAAAATKGKGKGKDPAQPAVSKTASPLFDEAIQDEVEKKVETGLPEGLKSLSELPAGQTYISQGSYVISTGDMQYSPQKLNQLARQIKGLPLLEAIAQMRFATRKPAPQLVRTLNHILHNTRQVQFGDPTRPGRGLVIAQAWVGKGIYSHGINIHGRGRFGRLTSPQSHMKIQVKVANVSLAPNRGNAFQGKRAFVAPKKERKNVKLVLPEKPIYNKWKKLFYDA